jgi:hypothetical protein
MTKQELEYVLRYTNESIEECKLEYDDLYERSEEVEKEREEGQITERQFEDEYNDLRHKLWIIDEIITSKRKLSK